MTDVDNLKAFAGDYKNYVTKTEFNKLWEYLDKKLLDDNKKVWKKKSNTKSPKKKLKKIT